jgi:hypothetical protein
MVWNPSIRDAFCRQGHTNEGVNIMGRLVCGLAGLGLLAAALPASVPAAAAPPERAKVGSLSCDISGGIGLIITSRKEVKCLFTPGKRGRQEVYLGSITKFGLDIGATTGGRMVWAVYAATRGYRPGALSGHYGGATAEATVGAGLGANVLVGGSHRTLALQPLSVQGQTGLNLAIGVAGLDLHPVR